MLHSSMSNIIPFIFSISLLWHPSIFGCSVHAFDAFHDNVTLTKLAFGSCHKLKYAQPEYWDAIAAQSPQAWLWTGDAIYPPTRGIASIDLLQKEFETMNNYSSYQEFKKTLELGVYGTWDDHDYGGNDAGAEMPDKQTRAKLFREFLQSKPSNITERNGVYNSVSWGVPPRQVKVILLDTRYFRGPHCVPSLAGNFPLGAGLACATRWLSAAVWPFLCPNNTSVLGETQWQWFERELANSQSALTIIVSSIQVLTTNPVMESWGHFPEERQRLVQAIQAHQNGATVILSGDVHHGEILDPGSLLEVTSSGLTHDCSKHVYGVLCQPLLNMFHAHRTNKSNYFVGKNFGTLHIDWQAQTFQVNAHDITNGKVVLTTGPRSLLHRPPRKSQAIPECMDGHLVPVARALLVALLVSVLIVWRLTRRNRANQFYKMD